MTNVAKDRDGLKEIRLQLLLIDELVAPILREVSSDREFYEACERFFDQRDNTVDDAIALTRMLATLVAAMSIAFDYPNPEGYLNEVRVQYEQHLAGLN